MGNSILAAQVPTSGCYPAGQVPGPLLAIRLGEGEWLGHGSLQAQAPVIVTTECCAQGPLFLRWRRSYRYERVTLATIECTLYAGEDFIHIRERSSRDSDLLFHFDLFPGLAPDHWTTYGGGEQITPAITLIDYAHEATLATVDFIPAISR